MTPVLFPPIFGGEGRAKKESWHHLKIMQTVEADHPLIGKKASTSITWIGKGLGVIKTESYNNKGKLWSRKLFTEFE